MSVMRLPIMVSDQLVRPESSRRVREPSSRNVSGRILDESLPQSHLLILFRRHFSKLACASNSAHCRSLNGKLLVSFFVTMLVQAQEH